MEKNRITETGNTEEREVTRRCRAKRVHKNGDSRTEEFDLVREIILRIYLNGRQAGEVSCTPEHIKEMTTGWMFTEGHIESPGEIESIDIEEDGSEVHVSTSVPRADTRAPGRGSNAVWKGEDIAGIRAMFDEDPQIRSRTGASHSCMIVRKAEEGFRKLFRSEDAGRHSALDKAIGWALLHDIDPGECLLMTSGRISSRMAAKAARAGAGALAGMGAPTAEAVEIAQAGAMTLIGYVREDKAVWFTEE